MNIQLTKAKANEDWKTSQALVVSTTSTLNALFQGKFYFSNPIQPLSLSLVMTTTIIAIDPPSISL